MMHRFLCLMVAAASIAVVLLVLTRVPAHAAPLCEVRSEAHQAEHGGFAADSTYHVSHGERPTCGEPEGSSRSDDRDDNDKSRYCRKRWFC